GCLTMIEQNKRRGSVEHVYRAVGRAYFSDADWAALEPEERIKISKAILQGLIARADEAMMARTFETREDRHLSWIAMKLDEQGWKEMVTTLTAAFGEVEQIRSDAEKRLGDSGEDPITSTCAILGFPSPSVPERSGLAAD
ncbi:MAG TPA: hypothetical protein VJ204_04710, partial [Solirubrobacterales bacterium]|nr:hypothetical protein [Solirubrobacterales bacterium]